jgi:hypothetical protein
MFEAYEEWKKHPDNMILVDEAKIDGDEKREFERFFKGHTYGMSMVQVLSTIAWEAYVYRRIDEEDY